MNLWAANDEDPTALKSFGKYTAEGTQTAYYKEFSYTPLEGLAQS